MSIAFSPHSSVSYFPAISVTGMEKTGVDQPIGNEPREAKASPIISPTADGSLSNASPRGDGSRSQINEEELQVIRELSSRDREVRAHEQAHLAAAGSLAVSGASFTYQQGPDGKRYAVGGEVSVDIAPVAGDPKATIEKARQIRAAALAPASPSAHDRQIAAQAAAMEQKAMAELLVESKKSQEKSLQPDRQETARSSETNHAEAGGCEICGGSHSSQSHVDSVKQKLGLAYGGIASQTPQTGSGFDRAV